MMSFVIGAALLLALGLAFLLWPLLRRERGPGLREKDLVALYRDQFRELSSDHAAGAINAEQFEAGRRELERRLLAEVAQPVAKAAPARRAGASAAAIAVFVLAVPIGLYLWRGKPEAINPVTAEAQESADEGASSADQGASGAAQKGAPHPITQQQVLAMVDQLAKRLEKTPQDGDGWAMLGRSYSYLHRFPEAVKAYARAAELLPKDSRLFADYADALAMTNERRLTGEPMRLVARALAINPADIKALALAGSEAFDRHDYTAAIGYWNRALKAGPKEPQFAEQLRSSIEEARKLGGTGEVPPPVALAAPAGAAAGGAMAAAPPAAPASAAAHASVSGRVRLAAALAAKAAPTDTVFIFARATQGPRMPLALLRRQVKDLPLDFALDETMAMMPDMNLSKFSTVVIGARVSHGGDAMPTSGDLQGFSGPVKVGSTGVQVQIDQVVP